jgi:hypothetical protein
MKREDESLDWARYTRSMIANHFLWDEESEKILKELTKNCPELPQVNTKEMDKMASNIFEELREMDKVKFKMIEAYSKPSLEKAVDEFLAGDIKLVDWKFNSYDGYYMFTCTYQELPSLD